MSSERLSIDDAQNHQHRQNQDLFTAFTPTLIAERERTTQAVNRFNDTRDTTRRHRVELWRDIVQDPRPMPPILPDPGADAGQFDATDPWIEPPLRADYGYNIKVAPGTFINFNAVWLDTLPITVGARTLVGPNCSFFSGGHPLDPAVRRGFEGPEYGRPIEIGADCWLGGNVIILPGVRIGRGVTVGAGSVVTKDVEPFVVVAGNPARVIRRIETQMRDDEDGGGGGA